MRLDKFIAGTGISRSDAAKAIRAGKVRIDGEICRVVDEKIPEDGAARNITFNGNAVIYRKFLYLMMNKPSGLVCENGRADSVFGILPENFNRRNLSVCGRLDKDTEGMLLLSDDGAFVHRIISPQKHLPKRYFVNLRDPANGNYPGLFASGLPIDGGDLCKPALLEFTGDPLTVFVTIREGMYHQIKRMFESLQNSVVYLKRVQTGGLPLPERLPLGETTELSPADLELLFS